MTFIQIANIVILVGVLLTLFVALNVLAKARRLLNDLNSTNRFIREDLEKLLIEVSGLATDANADVAKFEGLLDSANTLTDSLGSASRLAYNAMASPVVKVKAIRAGVSKIVGLFNEPARSKKGAR